MMKQPTRIAKKIVRPLMGEGDGLNGGSRTEEEEFDSLCSVELGESAKGEVSLKSVKVYAPNVDDAWDQAWAIYRRAKVEMAKS